MVYSIHVRERLASSIASDTSATARFSASLSNAVCDDRETFRRKNSTQMTQCSMLGRISDTHLVSWSSTATSLPEAGACQSASAHAVVCRDSDDLVVCCEVGSETTWQWRSWAILCSSQRRIQDFNFQDFNFIGEGHEGAGVKRGWEGYHLPTREASVWGEGYGPFPDSVKNFISRKEMLHRGVGMGRRKVGSPPKQLVGLGKHCQLPRWRPGWSPGRRWISVLLKRHRMTLIEIFQA